MSEKILLMDMFSIWKPQDDMRQYFESAELVSADLDPEERIVAVTVESPRYIPLRTLQKAGQQIAAVYGMRSVMIQAKHPAEQLTQINAEELMALFVAENSMTRGALAGASWTWEGTNLSVQLQANGVESLEKCVPAVKRGMFDRFGVNVDISFTAGKNLDGRALFEEMEKMRSTMLEDLPKTVQAAKKEEPAPASDAIFGKAFKGQTIPMHQLNLDMGFVIVEGRVFNIEHKELTKRNA